jgi:transposase-like protein
MDTLPAPPRCRGYRFPREIIAHCTWLYFRFNFSFRDIQEMMFERGVEVSHEAIRVSCLKFGAEHPRRLGRRRGHPGDTWHLDDVFCKINGQMVDLWRAVDQSGEVLDVLVQKRRNAKAAKRFFRKVLKGLQFVPRAILTDKLASYGDCAPQIITPLLSPPCPCGEITRSRSPSQWNIHDANLPTPISQVRAYPPPIDVGIRISGVPQLLAADPVRQSPACCAVYPRCNVRPMISGLTAGVPQTAESSDQGILFELSQSRAR